jgi:hypothetical protein
MSMPEWVAQRDLSLNGFAKKIFVVLAGNAAEDALFIRLATIMALGPFVAEEKKIWLHYCRASIWATNGLTTF